MPRKRVLGCESGFYEAWTSTGVPQQHFEEASLQEGLLCFYRRGDCLETGLLSVADIRVDVRIIHTL